METNSMDNIKKDIYDTICYFIHGLNNDDDLNNIVITFKLINKK